MASTMKAGDAFSACVRRDRIKVQRAAGDNVDPGLNAVIGKVGTIEYQGSWVKLPLEGASGEEFVVNLMDNDYFAEPVQFGDWVVASWAAQELHYV